MKFLAIFMTILVLASGFDLCADTGSCDEEERTELSKSDNKSQEKSEMCSPFCHCARCAFSILLPEKVEAFKVKYSSSDKFRYVLNALPTKVSNLIWQPPKSA